MDDGAGGGRMSVTVADESARPAGPLRCARRRALAGRHLGNLAEAMAAAQPPLFGEHVAWARTRPVGRGAPDEAPGRRLDRVEPAPGAASTFRVAFPLRGPEDAP